MQIFIEDVMSPIVVIIYGLECLDSPVVRTNLHGTKGQKNEKGGRVF